MNKLNPLYILILIITIFIISFVKLNDIKKDYDVLNREATTFKQKAKSFKEYKQTWFNKKRVTKKIDNIIKSSTFKKEKILKTQTSNMIRVKIESLNPRILNKFLNRVLNEKLIIRKLDIKKTSILFEIVLK